MMLWVDFMELVMEQNLLLIKPLKVVIINLRNIQKERWDSIFKEIIHIKVRLADRRNTRGSRICFIKLDYEQFKSIQKHIYEKIDEELWLMENGDLIEIIKEEEYDNEKVKSVENTLKQYLINKKKGEQSSKK